MLRSMTGFASGTGAMAPYSWTWELRAVNGKGQDLRLRVPDWVSGLDMELRKKLSAGTARGNISLALRISRDDGEGAIALYVTQVDAVLDALHAIETRALEKGVSLAPSRAADVAMMRGVLEAGPQDEDVTRLKAALLDDADSVIDAFNEMRSSEGAALEQVLQGQLTQIETLTTEAADLAMTRVEAAQAALKRNLAKVMENTDGIDAGRLEQELALIAVKSDVTEEIDRLSAHVEAARALIADGGPVGRKLDFLMQEFNREANTLCAKAQSTELTRCGLALKAVIDQMREQVQNVE
jgi:uncharacterized protein (TIGR00255 family)